MKGVDLYAQVRFAVQIESVSRRARRYPGGSALKSKSSACLCPPGEDYALPMFDLGRTFLAAVERGPDATAIVDGKRRVGYASWYEEIARIAGGLTALGVRRGDRLAVILQNRLEMASVHWACQFAGIVVTPLNWRIKPEELDYCLADADAAAIVFDDVAAGTVAKAAAQRLPRIAIGQIDGATCRFEDLQGSANGFAPRAYRFCATWASAAARSTRCRRGTPFGSPVVPEV